MEGSGVHEVGGGWRSCSVLPQPHRSPPALPTQALVRPQPEGEAGGQGKGGGRGSLRAADPPWRAAGSPLWGHGGCVHFGAERWDPGVLVPAEMSYWGQHEGVCGSWFCGGRDARLAGPVATLWGRGGSGGFGARLRLFYPMGLGQGARGQRRGQGRICAVPWEKGEEGCGVRSWPPSGSGRGPLRSGWVLRGDEGDAGRLSPCWRSHRSPGQLSKL